jgi:hypothetical protein
VFNNTGHDWQGELTFTHASGCTVINNIFLGDGYDPLMVMEIAVGNGNFFDYNLWFAAENRDDFMREIDGKEYTTLAAIRAASRWANHNLNLSPELSDPRVLPPDCRLREESPAIDRGDPATVVEDDEVDGWGGRRLSGAAIDIGADEYPAPHGRSLYGGCFCDALFSYSPSGFSRRQNRK